MVFEREKPQPPKTEDTVAALAKFQDKAADALDAALKQKTLHRQWKALEALVEVVRADPTHDDSLHEGPETATDPLMTYCPHCYALMLLRQTKEAL